MALQDLIESIQNFDPDQLSDFNNVGSWPLAIKIILWVVVFGGALGAGYFLHITKLQESLVKVQAEEISLRSDYESKWEKAVHLDGYRTQKGEMEESFGVLLRQLPADTEIPGLIEDITLVGLKNGLVFSSIDLKPEITHEFYIEKPIDIVVTGGYHELGSFVSDVADLSRIVTLHDFTIAPDAGRKGGDSGSGKSSQGGMLKMSITAKTYRYNDARG